MSSNNLPPVRHLPQWSRVGRLGKPGPPRRLPPGHNNQLPPLPVVPSPSVAVGAVPVRAPEVSCHSDADIRLASMQRNILFLQSQQKDTLERLHAEIEYLRRENKDLQYKLIMEHPVPKSSKMMEHHKSSKKALTQSRRDIIPPTQGSEASMGLYLEEQLQDTRPSQDQELSIGEDSEFLGSAVQEDHDQEGSLITSLQPLRIHSSPSHPPRAPTLQECEVIIRQLYNANSLQSQEIMRGKALLRDIVLSKKITPENYILIKIYLEDGTCKSSEENIFPKLNQTFSEKSSGPSQAGITLPALPQSLNSTIAERQKRSRAVQRDRLKRTLQ